jgi:hypothetical protein
MISLGREVGAYIETGARILKSRRRGYQPFATVAPVEIQRIDGNLLTIRSAISSHVSECADKR